MVQPGSVVIKQLLISAVKNTFTYFPGGAEQQTLCSYPVFKEVKKNIFINGAGFNSKIEEALKPGRKQVPILCFFRFTHWREIPVNKIKRFFHNIMIQRISLIVIFHFPVKDREVFLRLYKQRVIEVKRFFPYLQSFF